MLAFILILLLLVLSLMLTVDDTIEGAVTEAATGADATVLPIPSVLRSMPWLSVADNRHVNENVLSSRCL